VQPPCSQAIAAKAARPLSLSSFHIPEAFLLTPEALACPFQQPPCRPHQANPAILGSPHGASLLAEFVAAPWLLPPRTATVPYAGTHSLDALLGLRARPVGRHRSGVAMLLFDRHQPVMAQNSGGWSGGTWWGGGARCVGMCVCSPQAALRVSDGAVARWF
jgi:hypothetical protein